MSIPSKKELLRKEINLWILTGVRVVGIIGLLYELFIDQLRNPTALVVFGGLAVTPEAWELHRAIRSKAPEE